MVAKILDLKTLSWQSRPLHCQKTEGKNRLQMQKKKGGWANTNWHFTFLTQKWSSTKDMLVFCNKWKLLHEERVQSRQYFSWVYQHGRRLVFVLFSMSPPSWSWWSRVATLDLKHTDDTDASVQRTFIAKLHNLWSLWDFWGWLRQE